MKFRNLFFLVFPLIIFSYLIQPLDSSPWINNGKLFLNALLKADLRATYLDSNPQMHPGLSVEWISALIQFLLPAQLQNFLVPLHNLIFSTIFSICLSLGLSIFSKSFSRKALMSSAIYIILLPNLILIPGSTYLDWIISGTLFLSTALWLEYLNNKKFSLILWIGILIGVSFLTKYVSALIFPAFFIVALIKSLSIKSLIKPLATIFLIVSLIFVIFYPAMWIDPRHVLFSLFGKKESLYSFTVSGSNIEEVWKQFLRSSFKLNPIILIGSSLTLISFTKRVKKEILLPAVAGFTYLICLIAVVHVIFYSRLELLTFVYQLDRYTLPATMLFTVTFFEAIYQNQTLKKSYLLRNTLIILLFLYEIIRIAYYIIAIYFLS